MLNAHVYLGQCFCFALFCFHSTFYLTALPCSNFQTSSRLQIVEHPLNSDATLIYPQELKSKGTMQPRIKLLNCSTGKQMSLQRS